MVCLRSVLQNVEIVIEPLSDGATGAEAGDGARYSSDGGQGPRVPGSQWPQRWLMVFT